MSSFEKNAESTKTKSCNTRLTSKIVKTAGMIFGNLENVEFDPEIDCPPYACFNCWSFNHLIKDCPEDKSRIYCCNCGRKDVKVTECTRCSKAFFDLRKEFRIWIYRNFLNSENGKDEDKKEMRSEIDDMNWDEDEFESFYSCGYENENDVVEDDVKINWQSGSHYVQPNDLFAYMLAKKIKEEFKSDKINNIVVNLDDTRMADRDSFGENSIVSIEDFLKVSRSTGKLLPDFLKLLDAVKHLSVGTQEIIILQFMSERKKLVEMQNEDESKSS